MKAVGNSSHFNTDILLGEWVIAVLTFTADILSGLTISEALIIGLMGIAYIIREVVAVLTNRTGICSGIEGQTIRNRTGGAALSAISIIFEVAAVITDGADECGGSLRAGFIGLTATYFQ